MKTLVGFLIGLILLLGVSDVTAEDVIEVQPNDTTKEAIAGSVEDQESDQYVIYYLHMNRRCMTCEKLQAYSDEAISSGFAEQLKDSSIIWRIVNFEQEGNEHYAKGYQLYSQSLIVSKLHDGKETDWKNLDKIWQLVGNKDKFISYVQSEVKDFIKPAEEK